MKDKKMLYGGIVVVSVLLIYYLLKGESPITLITGGGKKGETPKPTGFDPIALAKQDPTFKAEVKILQTKLNAYVKAKNLKYPILKVDGMLGEKTLGVIENLFGNNLLPITNKIQVKYFISQLN
tara:strand:- start:4365 stop:4736 length:372 start_codon:yes stop_codon:yes gene_type:complete